MPQKVAKILIAYRTRVRPGLPVIDPTALAAPGNYKDKDKIAEWQAAKAVQLTAERADEPYTGTFDAVALSDPNHGRTVTYKVEAESGMRFPFGDRPAISFAVRQWVLSKYPDAWQDTTHPDRRPEDPQCIFVGFAPGRFLKLLAIELSTPRFRPPNHEGEVRLPLSMWLPNTDHRDVVEAIRPAGYCSAATWQQILADRGLAEAYPAWTRPHDDVTKDLDLITVLATQLGML